MTNLVLRELPESLLRELREAKVTIRVDSPTDIDLTIEGCGPLMRALLRAEAELLVADALAMESDTYVHRTPEERRHDAMQLILRRLRYVSEAA